MRSSPRCSLTVLRLVPKDPAPGHDESGHVEECGFLISSFHLRLCPNRSAISGSTDKDFDELNRSFAAIEGSTDKILKDAAQFCEHTKGARYEPPTA